MIDDSHCDKIHYSLISVHCFDYGYVGKQPVVWKEYCAESGKNNCRKKKAKCTGHRDIIAKILKTDVNNHAIDQSINQSINQSTNQSINQSIRNMSFCDTVCVFL